VQLEAVPRISVVIPTLNEHAVLRRSLDTTRIPGVERIVVDGGSEDGTRSAARFLRADRVLRSFPGRSLQMQAGAHAARGDVVLFLDAATGLEAGWDDAVLDALEDPRVMGGAFRLAYEGTRWVFRGLECQNWVATHVFGLACHEQALFVRRKLLEQSGGIRETPIFADLDLVRTIRDHGRLRWLPLRATQPVVRFEQEGVLRAWIGDAFERLGYLLDFDRERVARRRAA